MKFICRSFVTHCCMFVSSLRKRKTFGFISVLSCSSLAVSRGNLQHLEITDDVLIGLIDYPMDAFEIYLDPDTGVESIRIKSAYRTKKSKMKSKRSKKKTKSTLDALSQTNRILVCFLAAAIIISEEISPDDFYRTVDQRLSQSVYRLRREVAEPKGFLDLLEVNFDIVTDPMTRDRYVRLLSVPQDAPFEGLSFHAMAFLSSLTTVSQCLFERVDRILSDDLCIRSPLRCSPDCWDLVQ